MFENINFRKCYHFLVLVQGICPEKFNSWILFFHINNIVPAIILPHHRAGIWAGSIAYALLRVSPKCGIPLWALRSCKIFKYIYDCWSKILHSDCILTMYYKGRLQNHIQTVYSAWKWGKNTKWRSWGWKKLGKL